MKKSLIILSFAFIFLLTLSVVFAGDIQDEKISFGKWLKNLWGKITGTTITGMQISICTDSDNGKIYTAKGDCLDGSASYQDICVTSQIKEYFCGSKGCLSETVNCALGKTCVNGACITSKIISSPINNLEPIIGACADIDGDGYNPIAKGCPTPYDCNDKINGLDEIAGNADDGANIHPGAAEVCGNNIDEDCSGADLVCETSTCIDVDGGNVLNIADAEAGESCISSDIVNEFWCENNQLKNAPKSCKDFAGVNTFCYQGACASCVDTDIPAVNFTAYGETYNLSRINNHAKDSCKDSRYLNESSCSGNNVAFQITDCNLLGNSYSCQNGACYCKPNYIITACNSDDTALFRDASSCGLPDYTGDYDCNGDGLISGPSCAGMENENVGIDGLEFEADKNYTKITKPGTSLVQLAEDNGGGADFNWNFSVGAEPLNFCNIKLEVADSSDNFGYTIVKNVSAKNKTLWVERLNKTSGAVCIKDVPGEILISDFSEKCNGAGEVLVSCPGINSTYNCRIEYDTASSKASWFQVWPLNHSAVREITFLASAGTGAGACLENWNCTEFSDAVNQCGARTCDDLNDCRTTFNKPLENKTCVSPQEAGGCVPEWDCADFGKCSDGIKERVCADLNNCGDDSGKPSEQQNCRKISPLIIALIIVGLLLLIFLIWYFTRKKDEEDYPDETPAHTTHHSPPRSPPTNVYTPRPVYAR